MSSNVCKVDFGTDSPDIKQLYERLHDAVMNSPETMTVAAVLGAIEILKFNLINNTMDGE